MCAKDFDLIKTYQKYNKVKYTVQFSATSIISVSFQAENRQIMELLPKAKTKNIENCPKMNIERKSHNLHILESCVNALLIIYYPRVLILVDIYIDIWG